MKKYLLKFSAAGNRFLLADKTWFENQIPGNWEKFSYEIKQNFKDFSKLSQMSLDERKFFLQDLISPKEISLTDGLVVLKQSQNFIFECDFYNKDGSLAEMCGNAACCLSAYAEEMNLPKGDFCLGEEQVQRIPNGGIAFKTAPAIIGNHPYKIKNKQSYFTLIKSGVAHGVIECDKDKSPSFKNKSELKKLAQQLRFKNPKDSKGMNVSFFQVEKEDVLSACTFERGVEDFTLACGTGAVAVAFVYLHKYSKQVKEITISMPGGDLKVDTQNLSLFSPVKKGF